MMARQQHFGLLVLVALALLAAAATAFLAPAAPQRRLLQRTCRDYDGWAGVEWYGGWVTHSILMSLLQHKTTHEWNAALSRGPVSTSAAATLLSRYVRPCMRKRELALSTSTRIEQSSGIDPTQPNAPYYNRCRTQPPLLLAAEGEGGPGPAPAPEPKAEEAGAFIRHLLFLTPPIATRPIDVTHPPPDFPPPTSHRPARTPRCGRGGPRRGGRRARE